jgi:hypothetical protein
MTTDGRASGHAGERAGGRLIVAGVDQERRESRGRVPVSGIQPGASIANEGEVSGK